jgi:hypothetical protein
VAEDLGQMICQHAADYYSNVATPYPDDRPLEPPHSIDGDDLSEMCCDIWMKLGLPENQMPMRLYANTWREIAVVLQNQRRLIATP